MIAPNQVNNLEAATSLKAIVLLLAHMTRVNVSDKHLAEQQAIVVAKSAHMVNGVLQIAAARFWLATAIVAIDLRQVGRLVNGSYSEQDF
jgi:hypothetical protein